MVSNMTIAPHFLRLYAWDALRANVPQSFNSLVNGLIPIVPVDDEPKLAETGRAYIVYGYSESGGGTGVKEIKNGVVSFRVRTADSDELTHILNVLSRLFEDGDRTADNVNLWSDRNNFDGELTGIRFTYIETTYVESGDPAESEGGIVEAVINVSYRYISHHHVKTYTASGEWV